MECEIWSEAGWKLENKGKSIVFDLRPGIKSHRGKELFYKRQKTVMLMDVGWGSGRERRQPDLRIERPTAVTDMERNG